MSIFLYIDDKYDRYGNSWDNVSKEQRRSLLKKEKMKANVYQKNEDNSYGSYLNQVEGGDINELLNEAQKLVIESITTILGSFGYEIERRNDFPWAQNHLGILVKCKNNSYELKIYFKFFLIVKD